MGLALLGVYTRQLEASTMNQKYIVRLSEQERKQLEKLTSAGTAPARTLTRAHILLKSDRGPGGPHWTYERICEAFNVSQMLVARVRKGYVEQGLEATLYRKKPDREYERRLDGQGEAHLIALACSEPPAGCQRWTLRLLASEMVELGHVDRLSHETVRTALKKTNSNRG
jgi:hypothetical protein